MKRLVVLAFVAATAFAAGAENQYQIEFKLYRTVVPDAKRAAKEKTERSVPITGLIEGEYINEDAGFFMEDGQLIHRPANTNEVLRYELITSPSIATRENEPATIKIGEEIPAPSEGTDEDGKPKVEIKQKEVGTTVSAVVSESEGDRVRLETHGEFVTVVGRKQIAVVDNKGNAYATPILESTTWEAKIDLPLGAWLYQRVKVTQGHEFLVFARVTRFDADAEAKHEQYSVEAKLLRVPIAKAERWRKMFKYDEELQHSRDEARCFRVNTNEWPKNTGRPVQKTMDLDSFVSRLWKEDVELLSAPRITLNHSSLAKIVVTANNKAKDVPTVSRGGSNPGETPGFTSLFGDHVPHFKDQFDSRKPYCGAAADLAAYRDPADGSFLGFDGYVLGVQVDPRRDSDTLSLDLFFQHQFKASGKEGGFLRRSEPYTFDNQMFRFSELMLQDGGWLGFEFVSKQTGDLMLLLVEVDKVIPGGAREFDAGAKAPSVPVRAKSFTEGNEFASLAIPDDVELILDIVPQIKGLNVRLHTELLSMRGSSARSLLWADVVVPNKQAAVIGYDMDSAKMRAHLLGIGSKSGMQVPVSGDDTGKTFQGVFVPDEMDYVAGITPQVDGDYIRLWINFARKEDLGKPAPELDVWTNVIVRPGDAVTFGQFADGAAELLGIRPAATANP